MNDDQYNGPDDEVEDDGLMDIADEVSLADTGRRWGARQMRHPSMRPTCRYLEDHPFPKQDGRRTA